MEIKHVMEELISNNTTMGGINCNEDLYFLDYKILEKTGENILVRDDVNTIVGEIKKGYIEKIISINPLEKIVCILDFLPTGIVAIDTIGIVFYANAEYAKLLGKPLKEIIGNNINNLTTHSAIMTSAKTGQKILMERRYLETIGKNVSGIIYPIYTKGKLQGAVSIFSDTTLDDLENRVEAACSEVLYLRQKL